MYLQQTLICSCFCDKCSSEKQEIINLPQKITCNGDRSVLCLTVQILMRESKHSNN